MAVGVWVGYEALYQDSSSPLSVCSYGLRTSGTRSQASIHLSLVTLLVLFHDLSWQGPSLFVLFIVSAGCGYYTS